MENYDLYCSEYYRPQDQVMMLSFRSIFCYGKMNSDFFFIRCIYKGCTQTVKVTFRRCLKILGFCLFWHSWACWCNIRSLGYMLLGQELVYPVSFWFIWRTKQNIFEVKHCWRIKQAQEMYFYWTKATFSLFQSNSCRVFKQYFDTLDYTE